MGTDFPAINSDPTRRDALEALALLRELIETFPFVGSAGGNVGGNAGRSVALSAILTAMIRRSLPSAPMHTFSAPTAGSGKSMLVDIASVIATGHEAPVIAQGQNEEEMEKRLGAMMIAGDAIISIDNCDYPLGGMLLCQALTQATVKVRRLGKSEIIELPCNASFFATGNNLVIEGDMTRRALHAMLDAGVERPETRKFDSNPIEVAKGRRGEFVEAALTILRAYHVAGRPTEHDALGSFADWSQLVRGALIWLGEADPCDTMEDVRKADPKLASLTTVITEWHKVFGKRPVRTRDIIDAAINKEQVAPSEWGFVYPDLREALLHVANANGNISSRGLGRWLAANKGRVVGGKRIVPGTVQNGYQEWQLETVKTPEALAA